MVKLFSERKRRKSIPVQSVCRNCKTLLYSRYCHNCGQDLFAGARRSVKDLAYMAIENILVLDIKLLKTLKYLFFYPGKLTLEYVQGRIVSYVHPSKLFWFVSILFFALLTSQIKLDDVQKENSKEQKEAALKEIKKEISEGKNPNEPKDTFFDDEDLSEIGSSIQYVKALLTYAPYVSFLLIPFFAFLLFFLFRKKRYFYVDHMAFALHFHTFVFLLFTIYIIAKIVFPGFHAAKWFFVYLPFLYLVIALYVFYRPKIVSLIGKIVLLGIIYSIGSVIFILLVIVLGAILYKLL